jgi:hypothetical protein
MFYELISCKIARCVELDHADSSPININQAASKFSSVVGHTPHPVDSIFTPNLLLPNRNVGQQQRALIVNSENVQPWHPFLAKRDTSDTFEIC